MYYIVKLLACIYVNVFKPIDYCLIKQTVLNYVPAAAKKAKKKHFYYRLHMEGHMFIYIHFGELKGLLFCGQLNYECSIL